MHVCMHACKRVVSHSLLEELAVLFGQFPARVLVQIPEFLVEKGKKERGREGEMK